MLFVNLDQTYPLSQQYTSDIVCLFVEWVGTEAFYGLAPTTAGLSPNRYAYTRVIITSPSTHFWQVTTLIP